MWSTSKGGRVLVEPALRATSFLVIIARTGLGWCISASACSLALEHVCQYYQHLDVWGLRISGCCTSPVMFFGGYRTMLLSAPPEDPRVEYFLLTVIDCFSNPQLPK